MELDFGCYFWITDNYMYISQVSQIPTNTLMKFGRKNIFDGLLDPLKEINYLHQAIQIQI